MCLSALDGSWILDFEDVELRVGYRCVMEVIAFGCGCADGGLKVDVDRLPIPFCRS